MRHRLAIAAALAATMTPAAQAQDIAPAAVVFSEYGEIAEPLTGTPGNPVRGAEVITTRGLGNCIACHAVTDLLDFEFHGEVGPSLDGVATRWNVAQLRGIVANAKHTFPDSVMPAFFHTGPYIRPGDAFTGKAAPADLPPLLTAQDVEDVVAYLMTLDTYYD